MTYDYFIAAKWTNLGEVMSLTRQLRARGKSVYCFAEDDGGKLIAFTPFDDLKLTDRIVTEAYQRDMKALRGSSTLIMLMPAGKSSHIEAGIAHGLGKTCILVGEMGPTQGLYLIFDAIYPTVDEFLAHVK